jgi:hypothetical protein
MLENAVRICDAKFGNLFRFVGMDVQLVAEVGAPPELLEFLRQHCAAAADTRRCARSRYAD